MVRRATSEQVAEALHVGPATVRKYARAARIPFDTTPGGHRRYNVEEVVAALAAPPSPVAAPEQADVGERSSNPYVYVEPTDVSTVSCAVVVGGQRPIGTYDTEDEQEIWGQETPVV